MASQMVQGLSSQALWGSLSVSGLKKRYLLQSINHKQ